MTGGSDPAGVDATRATGSGPSREAVREALADVTDPELDRSIVDLEYVDTLEVDGDRVRVEVVLPTAWCSPAFAWMMVADAREAIEALPGVDHARVALRAHLHAEEITEGVAEGQPFEAAFPDADGGLEAVRAELDRKARIARQYDALEALLDSGLHPEQIVSLRPDAISWPDDPGERATVYLADRALGVAVPADPLESYLEKARETGLVDTPTDRLFATPEGEPIASDEFDLVRRRCRLAKVNMSSQGGICAGLKESRDRRFGEADD